ncbi:MAG: Ig-like domain-containing protein [Prevotellaceae bacterium]|jgi:uncharacterized protein (TIGR02145 family)|nr:Ig-like domain-containing protein [Prevotellaceae bacterium]
MTKNYFSLKFWAMIIALFAGFTFASCGEDEDEPTNNNTAVESISLNKPTLTIAIGESETLVVTTDPANVTVSWTSENANVVVDAKSGKVTGKAEGTAVITAKAGEKTATCTVTVRGALLNGVVWALRNVDAFGTFAAAPESTGKFYQWNRTVAWAGTFNENQLISGWDSSNPTGTEWEKANDPSPAGWRVPKLAEIEKLLDVAKVGRTWTAQNGVNGYRFTDNTNGASIFLPAVGEIESGGYHTHYEGTGTYWYGNYWSATQSDESEYSGKYLQFFYEFPQVGNDFKSTGLSVRSVLE